MQGIEGYSLSKLSLIKLIAPGGPSPSLHYTHTHTHTQNKKHAIKCNNTTNRINISHEPSHNIATPTSPLKPHPFPARPRPYPPSPSVVPADALLQLEGIVPVDLSADLLVEELLRQSHDGRPNHLIAVSIQLAGQLIHHQGSLCREKKMKISNLHCMYIHGFANWCFWQLY